MTARLEHLRVDHLANPVALSSTTPRFGWRIVDSATAVQTAYRLSIAASSGVVADTGRVESTQSVAVVVPDFAGEPGQDYSWRIQVWIDGADEPITGQGNFGIARQNWSSLWAEPDQESVIPDGLLASTPAEFARAAAAPPVAERLHPPRRLRQEFILPAAPARAKLRATAQGVIHTTINGRPTSDALLEPGSDSYHLIQPVVTHDVTSLLRKGTNVLGIVLGDGWYAGRISFLGQSAQYGDRLRASWELEVQGADGEVVFVRPDTDVMSSRGSIDYSDLFIGERHDARLDEPGWNEPGFRTDNWTRVMLVPFESAIRAFSGEPVRRLMELPAERVWQSPAGEWLVDFGQVIAGRVRMTVQGPRGAVVRLEHTEAVTPEGDFTQNILGINKDQADEYVLAGSPDPEIWEPLFTYHGFRYLRVQGFPGTPLPEAFMAIVIGDDLEVTAGFESSDPRLNRLFENAVWSQRANFLAVPTDCPQREKAGYTGDIQIFAPAAATLMGVAAVLERWLGTVRREQAQYDGRVPAISPEPPAMPMGRGDGAGLSAVTTPAGWSDAITAVPWALWEHYGDDRFLSDNIQAMRDWVAVQTREAREQLPPRLWDIPLEPDQRTRQELLWNGRFHFGDWVTPSTMTGIDDPMEACLVAPRLTSELVAPMWQVRSLDLLARALDVLGESEEASSVRDHAAAVRAAFAAEYLGTTDTFDPDLQGMYVLALAFGMVPPEREAGLAGRLAELVVAAGNHLDTGFLSTPYLLDVLWNHGHRELARTLLWQDTCPSWLYEVSQGATTIWESWHAVHEDGQVEVTSLNHYAFGCVVDWMMRRLAGLQATTPAYREVRVSPDLDGPLDWVKAYIDTPYGRLAIEWRRDGKQAEVVIDVPSGVAASLRLPPGWTMPSLPQYGPGHHAVKSHFAAEVTAVPLRICDQSVSGPRGPIPIRTYLPPNPKAGLVWLHGGAFRFGDLDMPEADWTSRRVAEGGIAVISVDYRLTVPGVHFPVPGDDVLAVWRWVQLAAPFGVPAVNWSAGGASAGGNLAAALCHQCRDGLAPAPRSAILVYPVLHSSVPAPSPELAGQLAGLPEEMRFRPETCVKLNLDYVGEEALLTHPYAYPAYGDPHGLPPTLIVNAATDDLRPSGEAYGATLAAAGVTVTTTLEPGTVHGYLNEAVSPARQTVSLLTDWLLTPI